MEEVGERYIEVMVDRSVNPARALQPISERSVFGKSVMLFDGVARSQLATLGELRTPSLADLFVATMKGSLPMSITPVNKMKWLIRRRLWEPEPCCCGRPPSSASS